MQLGQESWRPISSENGTHVTTTATPSHSEKKVIMPGGLMIGYDHVRCHLSSNFHSSSRQPEDFHLSAGRSNERSSERSNQRTAINWTISPDRAGSFCSIALFKRSMYHLAYNLNTPTNKQTSQMPNNCNFPYFCRVYDRTTNAMNPNTIGPPRQRSRLNGR